MTRVRITITFKSDDGTDRSESDEVEVYTLDPSGERWLVHMLSTELRASLSERPAGNHSAAALGWLNFPDRPIEIEEYFDVRNSHAVWIELASLVLRTEATLARSQGFKALEPPKEPRVENDDAINDLYRIHSRKMQLLDQAVYNLVKVQDIVNRLLHESLGGDLVDTSEAEW